MGGEESAVAPSTLSALVSNDIVSGGGLDVGAQTGNRASAELTSEE